MPPALAARTQLGITRPTRVDHERVAALKAHRADRREQWHHVAQRFLGQLPGEHHKHDGTRGKRNRHRTAPPALAEDFCTPRSAMPEMTMPTPSSREIGSHCCWGAPTVRPHSAGIRSKTLSDRLPAQPGLTPCGDRSAGLHSVTAASIAMIYGGTPRPPPDGPRTFFQPNRPGRSSAVGYANHAWEVPTGPRHLPYSRKELPLWTAAGGNITELMVSVRLPTSLHSPPDCGAAELHDAETQPSRDPLPAQVREQKRTEPFQREMNTIHTTVRRAQSARQHRDRNPLHL